MRPRRLVEAMEADAKVDAKVDVKADPR
jgi:hypothetical protein